MLSIDWAGHPAPSSSRFQPMAWVLHSIRDCPRQWARRDERAIWSKDACPRPEQLAYCLRDRQWSIPDQDQAYCFFPPLFPARRLCRLNLCANRWAGRLADHPVRVEHFSTQAPAALHGARVRPSTYLLPLQEHWWIPAEQLPSRLWVPMLRQQSSSEKRVRWKHVTG